MKRILRFLLAAALLALLALLFLMPAHAASTYGYNPDTRPSVRPALTNVVVITNGVTTFAGTTNAQLLIGQGIGQGLGFMAYATNAGQLTFFFTPTLDGTNYVDTGNLTVWGTTLNASGWVTRGTNIPASYWDNYTKWKILMVSNSAATVVISNCVETIRQ